MRQAIGLITGILTFATGVLFVGLTQLPISLPEVQVQNEADAPINVNPCVLSSTSEALIGKSIVVQATLFHVGGYIMVYPNIWHDVPVRDCGESDPARAYLASTFDPSVWTDLNLKDYRGPNANLGELFEQERADWEIDVEIEGVLVKHVFSKNQARYGITPSRIRLVSTWRRFTPKGAA